MNRYRDMITGAAGLAVGALILMLSIQIGQKENNIIGAAFLPEIVAVLTLILSGKLCLEGWQKSKGDPEPAPDYVKNYTGVAVMMAACILYAQLLKPVGFVITSTALLFLTFCLMSRKEERNYVKFAVLSVVTVAAVYLVFTRVFGIRLPQGILQGIF